MPKVKGKGEGRINIRIPKAMADEIDRIVEKMPYIAINRQQFVERAISEKIERVRLIEARLESSEKPLH
jgi:metal-responsive CopG/Arc/MetJ family transcriptional regulator